ncbi:MAG: DNA repair protein RecN, partial [Candidatus Eremiobacteraeota bacterium]|nr:DNA repair protein RecN [Candidatus Eremiobacteraeota bacterium]
MLQRLEIENYGLIAGAEIEFASGATMFTGETGSGKTMLVGALGFVLGERAGADVVRRGAARATVTLTFEPDESLRERLGAGGFEIDAGEDAVITREMSGAGKSTMRLNGRVTTATHVRELAAEVAEIVGQHEAQRLLAASVHLDLLDRFAGERALAVRARVAELYEEMSVQRRALEEIAGEDARAQRDFEFAQFARDEIVAAAPEADEDERLSERRRFLDNVERIAESLQTAHAALAGDDASAIEALGVAAMALRAVENVDGALRETSDAARSLQEEIGALSARIARTLEATEFDPNELEAINERLDVLDRLKRKYGGSIATVLAARDEYAHQVETYATRDERRDALQARLRDTEALLEASADELSGIRKAAVKRLSAAVTAEFADLALQAGRFEAVLTKRDAVGARGREDAEFLFAANKGEELRPLARVASGGELSRVLLAVMVALSDPQDRGALIFDEIDAGIGGATANAVGVRLARLAMTRPVVCVTHLAQIASLAERHYVLDKRE